jgi:hypothetical protein
MPGPFEKIIKPQNRELAAVPAVEGSETTSNYFVDRYTMPGV